MTISESQVESARISGIAMLLEKRVELAHEVNAILDRIREVEWLAFDTDVDGEFDECCDERKRASDKLRVVRKELLKVDKSLIKAGYFNFATV